MYVKVRVIAGAKKEKIKQTSPDHFEVSVKEEAKQNMANGKVRELIAAHFGATLSAVRIISGHHSPGKILRVDAVVQK